MPRGVYDRKKSKRTYNRKSVTTIDESPSQKQEVASTGESYNVHVNGKSTNVSSHSIPIIRTALEHELVLATRRVDEVKKALAEIPETSQ